MDPNTTAKLATAPGNGATETTVTTPVAEKLEGRGKRDGGM
jgi:hypothetical protein